MKWGTPGGSPILAFLYLMLRTHIGKCGVPKTLKIFISAGLTKLEIINSFPLDVAKFGKALVFGTSICRFESCRPFRCVRMV